MPKKSFTFNGIRKPWLHMTRGRTKPLFTPVQRNILTVPGMPGGHLSSTEIEPISFIQPIAYIAKDDNHALQIKDELAEWLITDKPAPLQFDDEPGRTYYAIVQNTIEDFERIAVLRQGAINFLCLDPFSYGEEQTKSFTSDILTLPYKGTAPASPIFELEVKEPVTYAMVSNNNNKYMLVGKPVDVEETEPVADLTHVLNKRLDDFVGFTDLANGSAIDDPLGGVVAGKFQLGNGQWMVTDYGTNPNGWHGPAKITSFSESLQDFQIDHFITQLNFAGQLGKNALFLRDENDKIITSLGSVDKTITTGYYSKVQFYLGGRKLIFDFEGFNNTQMWLRLRRKGTLFTATAYQLDDNGNAKNRVTRYFDDENGEFTNPIRQAVIHVSTFKEYKATRMYVNRLKAARVNDVDANQIPYIAYHGDIIKFDTKNYGIYINGEPVKTDIAIGSSFFDLVKGDNQLVLSPPEAFNAKVIYRETHR